MVGSSVVGAIDGEVVDVAIAAGNFQTLIKILSDLGLDHVLRAQTAQTIFAPSDEAFAKLPAGTLESLTPSEKFQIVRRHVVAGATVVAADVMASNGVIHVIDNVIL